MLFKKKVFLKEIDSTNDHLINLDNTFNIDEGFVLISDYQNKGRGRMAKSWQSEKSKNLLFSFILKPTFLPIKKQFYISAITSIAIFDVLQNYTSEKINIKWPNDILINEKKIAGILLDFKISSSEIKNCVVGCGININQKLFSNLDNATSLLNLSNQILDRNIFLDQFLDTYSNLYSLLVKGNYNSVKNRYLSLVENYTSKTIINNIKTEIRVLDILNNGDILVLCNGEKKKMAFSCS